MTIEELQKAMKVALESGDVKAIEEAASAIIKSKADRAKEVAEGQRKEAEALAGDREKLASQIHKAIKGMGLDDQIKAMKGWGFTYKVDRANPAEPDLTYKAVSLSTQAVKAPRAGGTGGGAGKSKDEYGMGLQEIYDKFHTADDDVKMADAEAKDKTAGEKLGKATNSNAWRVKNDVKKRAIAENLLPPVK